MGIPTAKQIGAGHYVLVPEPRRRTPRPAVAADELLERSDQLAALEDALAAAGSGDGRLLLVAGDAGAGKTTLLRHFCRRAGASARVLWGECDALFTPHALGPFLAIAEATEGEFQRVVDDGAKPQKVVTALTRELSTAGATIVVVEDAHWADEATLDVLRLLARRIGTVPALIVVSSGTPSLRVTTRFALCLASWPPSSTVDRLRVEPLSPAAVAALARPRGLDPGELYRRTAGNAFFVTEAIAAGDRALPETVRDAVLARTARVSASAVTLLEAVSVVPQGAEVWLLREMVGDEIRGSMSVSRRACSCPSPAASRSATSWHGSP